MLSIFHVSFHLLSPQTNNVVRIRYDVVRCSGVHLHLHSSHTVVTNSTVIASFEEEEEERMIRTRLLWFSVGFTTSAAVVSNFVWKDVWVDRHDLASHMSNKFDALQTRISNLESPLPNHTPVSNQDQVEG